MQSLREQSRSHKGRRPPFDATGVVWEQHIDDDDVSIEELEFGTEILLADFESVREWNAKHDDIIAWFYEEGSPCLIDPRHPSQHARRYLTNFALAARERGRRAVHSSYVGLFHTIADDRAAFNERFLEPWKAKSQAQREETILAALSAVARLEELGGRRTFARNRRLVPEITLEHLCQGQGRGLVDLIDTLCDFALDPTKLSTHPVPNDQVFRKLGIAKMGELPPSMADRALQDELLLIRHSMLATLVHAILDTIVGAPVQEPHIIGNVEAAVSRANNPELADLDLNKQSGPLAHTYSEFHRLTASALELAEGAGINKMLLCQRCHKVGRIEHYCSSQCQKHDWPYHKGNCGKRLDSFVTVPIPVAFTPAPTSLHPLRLFVLRTLDRYPLEFWAIKSNQLVPVGFQCVDKVEEDQIRQGVRRVARRALRDGHPPSISLLAFALIRNLALDAVPRNDAGKITNDPVEDVLREREKQFREMFELEDATVWDATLARGREELKKDENAALKLKKHRDWFVAQQVRLKPGVPDLLGTLARHMLEVQLLKAKGMSTGEIADALAVGVLDSEDDDGDEEEGDAVNEPEGLGRVEDVTRRDFPSSDENAQAPRCPIC
ncbi:hypothetical protein JCM11491_000239 [Sporobolomyces phaffii]